PIGKVSGPWAYFFGFFAGGLGGAISASGPPVIVYTSLQAWTKDQIKVTLQGFFIIAGLLIGVFHAANGLTTDGVIRNFLVSIPTLLMGTWAGSLLYGKFKEEGYRRVMLALLGALGVFTLARVL
ncbi:MAG: sulfite exporter TauE/SafE family protein, partial [Deltaproteobacteria bacterium]|nr:sulfite exporter TauE/SafE family protein [Deltaproteobacteria bacterium]